MTLSPLQRGLLWLSAIVLVLTALTAGGLYLATRILKSQVESALGPHGTVGNIRVGFSSIEVLDLKIKAAAGWPAGEELSARRVVIVPDLRALLSRDIRISSIRIEEAYLSMLRRKDGQLLLVPSLLAASAKTKDSPGKAMQQITVGGITLENCAVDFFDATVRQPPLRLRLEQVNSRLGTIALPELRGRTAIELTGIIKGVQRDGRLNLKGNAEIATRDSELTTQLRGVDLVALQPYLIKATESGVRRGALDLDLKSTVRNHRLSAPGTITLSQLELTGSGNFMGMSRATLVSTLKDRQGKITAKFVLEGRIDDPKFSLNEGFALQVGSSLGKVLGISLEGLTKGVGSVGSSAAKGLGETIEKLFGK